MKSAYNPPRVIVVVILLLTTIGPLTAEEPVIGGPCEGCELVFAGIPDELSWNARIARPEEPGTKLRIEGVVRNQDGDPTSGIIVYAYQTDASGVYPKGSTRHGRLRAWARTGEDGRYRFDTIRPGAYPGRGIPEHVHLHVIEPGFATYWIADINIADDPLLTERDHRRLETGRGGSGLVKPEADPSGGWLVQRDIVLGLEVPGYSR